MRVTLDPEELQLVIDALDSHEYWQLSDPRYRNNGYAYGPGSDDAENAAQIVASQRLAARLERLVARARRRSVRSPAAR